MRSHRGWMQSPSGLREKSIGYLGKVHRAFGKSPSVILGSSRGHFGEVQGPGSKARWTFHKTRWTFISWGCGGGFSHNGGANHVLDCHRFELNVGFVRVGLSCALPLGMHMMLKMLNVQVHVVILMLIWIIMLILCFFLLSSPPCDFEV
jgi:hypothetical protein